MRRRKRYFLRLILTSLILITICIGTAYLTSYILEPPPLKNEPMTVYYSKDGEKIGQEKNKGNGKSVSLDDISPHLVKATLVVEDKKFFDHYGFDIQRIGGAILKDLKSLSLKEGASTLTQQFARNLYLSHEKTWTRKLKEAFYTIRLEMYYTKDEILTGYLNTIYYGHGAYGIDAASKYFFNKEAKDLTIAEAAMLSGIPKGPTYYSPFNDYDRAKQRQELILQEMYNEKMITKSEYDHALREDLQFTNEKEQREIVTGPFFRDLVLREAAEILHMDLEEVKAGGLNIYTTLDQQKQKTLEENIKKVIDPSTELEVAAMTVNPFTGHIEALVGGKDYKESSFNRAISAKRMPGSTFKPFLYYQALENGFQPNTMLESKPTTFELSNGEVYEPSNFNNYYAEKPITLAQAIALSDNVYAVKTHMHLEPEQLVYISEKIGIKSELPPYPSLALGSTEVSLKEMMTGYSTFANGGRKIKQKTIKKITDQQGNVLFEDSQTRGKQILDRQKVFILTSLMEGMFDRDLDGYMSVTGSTIAHKLSQKYAGKSGSTDVDSWMIGYSPNFVTGIWIGYDDSREITNQTEMGYAKEIWASYMEDIHDNEDEKIEEFPMPAGLVPVEIDLTTGKKASPYCSKTKTMYFEKRFVPTEACTEHIHGGEIKEIFDEEKELKQLEKRKKKIEQLKEDEGKHFFDQWREWLTS